MYAQEEINEVMPKAEKRTVKDLLDAYGSKELLKCPAKPDAANGYGYNVALSGKSLGAIADPNELVIFADCKSADNLIHSLTILITPAMVMALAPPTPMATWCL